jgi:hypothetical protein
MESPQYYTLTDIKEILQQSFEYVLPDSVKSTIEQLEKTIMQTVPDATHPPYSAHHTGNSAIQGAAETGRTNTGLNIPGPAIPVQQETKKGFLRISGLATESTSPTTADLRRFLSRTGTTSGISRPPK